MKYLRRQLARDGVHIALIVAIVACLTVEAATVWFQYPFWATASTASLAFAIIAVKAYSWRFVKARRRIEDSVYMARAARNARAGEETK